MRIDVHDLGPGCEVLPEPEPEVHGRADDDDEVGLLHRLRSAPRERKAVVGRKTPTTLAVHEDRDPGCLRQVHELILGLVHPHVRAGDKDRSLRAREFVRDRKHCTGVKVGNLGGLRVRDLDRGGVEQDVQGEIEEAGATWGGE